MAAASPPLSTASLHGQDVHEPGVDALVAAADEGQGLLPRQFAGQRLRQRFARGGKHDDSSRTALPLQFAQGLDERLKHHHHARPAAVGPIIDDMVAILGSVARVEQAEVNEARLARLAEQRGFERRGKPFGKEGHYVDSHGCRLVG